MSRMLDKLLSIVVLLAITVTSVIPSFACTRVVYLGSDGLVLTGRTMDWSQDIQSNLWAFPRGMKRNGAAGQKSILWVSKYGSIVVSGYEAGSADGMNEKGLVANALYLAESNYGKPDATKPQMSIMAWVQYALDNFATVAEAVDALGKEPFQIIAPVLPSGDPAQLHLSLSDVSGDSAVFEYINGKLVIHHGKQYQVMTNSPKFDEQLALNTYWKEIGGQTFLPGTNRAADRFVRASYMLSVIPTVIDTNFIKAVPEGTYANQAVASVMGLMRSVSVPIGISSSNEPNIASTLWRTLADSKNKIYYFDSATSPNTFWVTLSDFDFKEGTPVKKLTVAGGKIYSGNVSNKFEPATAFTFLPANGG